MAEIRIDAAPELGSSEAAVRSFVNLMTLAINAGRQIEEAAVAYWLDCYYQLRSVYEREAGSPPLRREDLRPVTDELQALRSLVELLQPADPYPIPAPQPSDPFKGTPWANYKRQQRDRLELAREAGIKIAEISGTGLIGESDLLSIMEGRKMPLKIYQQLEAALDMLESQNLT